MSSTARPPRKLKTDEVAKVLEMSPETLRRWRSRGTGPAFLRLGRAIRYDPRDVQAFATQQRVEPRGAV